VQIGGSGQPQCQWITILSRIRRAVAGDSSRLPQGVAWECWKRLFKEARESCTANKATAKRGWATGVMPVFYTKSKTRSVTGVTTSCAVSTDGLRDEPLDVCAAFLLHHAQVGGAEFLHLSISRGSHVRPQLSPSQMVRFATHASPHPRHLPFVGIRKGAGNAEALKLFAPLPAVMSSIQLRTRK
jgi:hypothetical protein